MSYQIKTDEQKAKAHRISALLESEAATKGATLNELGLETADIIFLNWFCSTNRAIDQIEFYHGDTAEVVEFKRIQKIITDEEIFEKLANKEDVTDIISDSEMSYFNAMSIS